MNRNWVRGIAAVWLVAALAPKAASAQNRDRDAPLGLSTAIAVEATRLASDGARQPAKVESASQSPSGPGRGRGSSRAKYGVAFGFAGLLVGAAIAEKLPRSGRGTTAQLTTVAIGGGSGFAIGIWLGGR